VGTRKDGRGGARAGGRQGHAARRRLGPQQPPAAWGARARPPPARASLRARAPRARGPHPTPPCTPRPQIVRVKRFDRSYVLYQCGTPDPSALPPGAAAGVTPGMPSFEIPLYSVAVTDTTVNGFLVRRRGKQGGACWLHLQQPRGAWERARTARDGDGRRRSSSSAAARAGAWPPQQLALVQGSLRAGAVACSSAERAFCLRAPPALHADPRRPAALPCPPPLQSELNLIDRVALASPYSVENCFQRLVDTKSQDGAREGALEAGAAARGGGPGGGRAGGLQRRQPAGLAGGHVL
jgi:hypothetical protein